MNFRDISVYGIRFAICCMMICSEAHCYLFRWKLLIWKLSFDTVSSWKNISVSSYRKPLRTVCPPCISGRITWTFPQLMQLTWSIWNKHSNPTQTQKLDESELYKFYIIDDSNSDVIVISTKKLLMNLWIYFATKFYLKSMRCMKLARLLVVEIH